MMIKLVLFIKIKIDTFTRYNIYIRILNSIKNCFTVSFLIYKFKIIFSLASRSFQKTLYVKNYHTLSCD